MLRLLLLGLCCSAAQAHAQTWPSRPIKLVVPTGPGAATDVMARLLSDGISRALGQPVVVENQPAHPASWRIRPSRARRPTATRSCSPTPRA